MPPKDKAMYEEMDSELVLIAFVVDRRGVFGFLAGPEERVKTYSAAYFGTMKMYNNILTNKATTT